MSGAFDVSQSFEQQAEEALREAHSVSNLNATTGELYGIPRWYRSPAARALEVLDGGSSSVRAWRLNEGEAWGMATRLFERDGATRSEIEGIERQCDLKRKFVLPLRVGKKPANYFQPRPGYRDALAQALSWRKRCVREGGAPGLIVRGTHRDVHRALADDDTSWCAWCVRGGAPR